VTKPEDMKADWASLVPAAAGAIIICAKTAGQSRCIYFDSADQLKQALEKKRLSVKRWAVTVPAKSCILKTVSMPAVDVAEAARMIEFELPSLVPLAAEELVWGCTHLKRRDNMLDVLVCILKVKTLNQYLHQYNKAGIKPRRIALDWLAIHHWLGTVQQPGGKQRIGAVIGDKHAVVLTSVDENFQQANEVTFSDSQIQPPLVQTLPLILSQWEHMPAHSNDKTAVILSTVPESLSALGDSLDEVRPRLSGTLVSLVAAPKVTHFADGALIRDGSVSIEATEAAGLLDLASTAKLPESNLLPPRQARRIRRKMLIFNYSITASMTALSILLLWLCFAAMSWRLARACRPIQAEIAPIEHIARAVESKRLKVRVIEEQLSARGQITRIVEELYRYTPRTVSISELVFVRRPAGASVEIKAQADTLSNAFDYAEAMHQATLLRQMQIENAQQVPRPGGSVVQFKALCFIGNEQADDCARQQP